MEVNWQEVEKENKILRDRYEKLLLERDALEKLANDLRFANLDMEKELDGFLKADDSVCKVLEERDERYSPIRS